MPRTSYLKLSSSSETPVRLQEPCTAEAMELISFDRLFMRRFRLITRVALPDNTVLLLLLLFLSIFYQVIVYQVGLMTSRYYVVLGNHDWYGFLYHTGLCSVLILLIASVKSTKNYVASTLTIQWRQSLTQRLQELYFTKKVHYKINVLEGTVDNPDQRIAQDVDRLCQKLTDIIPTVIVSPFTIAYYSYQSFLVTGPAGPLSVVCYFIVSTVINKVLIAPVVPRVYEQEKQEGRFRYKHAQIRSNSESIAFLDGEDAELECTTSHLGQVMKAQQNVINKQFPLNLAVSMSDYMGSVLSFLVLAVPVFSGRYGGVSSAELSGIISKNTFVSMYLISCFSSLLDLSNGISAVAGNTHRICVLMERMEAIVEEDECCDRDSERAGHDGPYFQLDDVSCGTPRDSCAFVEGLTLTLKPGRNVFITGSSNSGKTSLLRVLKGLWQPSCGRVTRVPKGSLFLPQVPWFGSGSLRSQLLYPNHAADKDDRSDGDIEHLFRLAELEHLIKRSGGLHTVLQPSWYENLSPGEKQRLCFLRLLHQRPHLAFLDEATSALDATLQTKLYNECKRVGITTVTIGHHSCLRPHHDGILELLGDGRWTYSEETLIGQ
ncbi:lysosomal cobalamin transporter ABCD4-like [Ornithodoros turicata]|uniref:lysosomal cobalamin transporter ABCD4-like n=1 Tax=Ornithodoros turicata TaxID=34597 RepID=UPI003139F37D